MAKAFSLDFLRIKSNELTNECGRIEYVHTKKNQSGTAYPSSEGVSLLLFIPRTVGASDVCIELYDDSATKKINSIPASLKTTDANTDVYSVSIKSGTLECGLYFFDVVINSVIKIKGYKNANKICFSNTDAGEKFQLTVFDEVYEKPANKYGGIIYHVFVDRFARGGLVCARKDAVMVSEWNSEIPEYPAYPGAFLRNNTFFGGTLYGIIDKLDYLVSLGVNTIYLSPIFEAYSNHKYDTGDYSKVDEMFGGDEAFRLLIKEAKKKGIGIILEYSIIPARIVFILIKTADTIRSEHINQRILIIMIGIVFRSILTSTPVGGE